jgi:3-isopropylmalate dehydratase small subunit
MVYRTDFEQIPGVLINKYTVSQKGNGLLPFYLLLSTNLLDEIKREDAQISLDIRRQEVTDRKMEITVKQEILDFIATIGEELKDNVVVQEKIEAFFKLLKPDTKLLNQAFLGHVTKNAEDPRGFHLN